MEGTSLEMDGRRSVSAVADGCGVCVPGIDLFQALCRPRPADEPISLAILPFRNASGDPALIGSVKSG